MLLILSEMEVQSQCEKRTVIKGVNVMYINSGAASLS